MKHEGYYDHPEIFHFSIIVSFPNIRFALSGILFFQIRTQPESPSKMKLNYPVKTTDYINAFHNYGYSCFYYDKSSYNKLESKGVFFSEKRNKKQFSENKIFGLELVPKPLDQTEKN
ncbi:hypothetical protein CEXT_274531 [Caerostris extrusa]|uniref:Uncharacterized protein n=1 Tax=Caerostris extrusa TaxID=172846 RepID=A0AAV4Y722_CAEEX|nr:hypothetical protein CEXT_274531 [Caerostris extrusa]